MAAIEPARAALSVSDSCGGLTEIGQSGGAGHFRAGEGVSGLRDGHPGRIMGRVEE